MLSYFRYMCFKHQTIIIKTFVNILIEVGFGDREESAVTVSTHTKNERLSREHSQLAHQLSWVSHK